jgi:hypothetical protein
LKVLSHLWILHFRVQLLQAERLGELLEENLDEDSRTRRRRLFGERNVRQTRPRHGVGGEQVSEKLGHIAKFVRLQTVNGAVLLHEDLVEQLRVDFVDKTESAGEQTVVTEESALLRATLDEHRAQLNLGARRNVHLHQFVTSLFKIQRGHDGEVDSASKIHEVGLGEIRDVDLAGIALRRRRRGVLRT